MISIYRFVRARERANEKYDISHKASVCSRNSGDGTQSNKRIASSQQKSIKNNILNEKQSGSEDEIEELDIEMNAKKPIDVKCTCAQKTLQNSLYNPNMSSGKKCVSFDDDLEVSREKNVISEASIASTITEEDARKTMRLIVGIPMRNSLVMISQKGCISKKRRCAHRRNKHSKEFMAQSFWYLLAFYVSFTFACAARVVETITGDVPYTLILLFAIFFPLQGFFNFLVYIRPRYIKAR